jgi:hypothetical protein
MPALIMVLTAVRLKSWENLPSSPIALQAEFHAARKSLTPSFQGEGFHHRFDGT